MIFDKVHLQFRIQLRIHYLKLWIRIRIRIRIRIHNTATKIKGNEGLEKYSSEPSWTAWKSKLIVPRSVSDPHPDPQSIGRLDPDPGGLKRAKMKKKTQQKSR
jgi:hypothetical protein